MRKINPPRIEHIECIDQKRSPKVVNRQSSRVSCPVVKQYPWPKAPRVPVTPEVNKFEGVVPDVPEAKRTLGQVLRTCKPER